MKKNILKSLSFAILCGFCAFCANAAVSLFSDYGQIQNVQNYSTNPFWTPNSPYNQRLPQPVYVQGADVDAEECIQLVQSMVGAQCMARDNCKNTTLAEIRPEIMVQLSRLPNKNYVSACSGYMDTIFEQYVAQYGNNLPNRAVAFPNATTPNQNLNNNGGIEIKNPYKQIPNQWQMEIKERSNELQQLQQQNGAGSEHLSATAFPTTFEDLSFSDRMAIKAEGYEPYKDASAYVVPDFVDIKQWCSGDGSDSDMCKKYAAKNNHNNSNNNGSNNGNNSNNDNKIDDDSTTGLCLNYKKFDLSSNANTVFADIQVHTPEIAQKLTQEYIKCSSTPDLIATSNYSNESNDDLLHIKNNEHQIMYKVRFDDVTESSASTFGMDTIKALCLIASGTTSNLSCPRNTPACFQDCFEITEGQFSEIANLTQILVAPEGENFKGMGTYCYKITYTKSAKQIHYSVFQARNCKNEILVNN